MEGTGSLICLGTSKGLWKVGLKSIENIDKIPVVGIVQFKPEGERLQLLIARSTSLELWDGAELKKTTLYDSIGKGKITALRSRTTGEVWIGTEQNLWRLKGNQLGLIEGISGVKTLSVAQNGAVLLEKMPKVQSFLTYK